ncbi:hypothetical protein MMC14_000585 [Varicellaria rhodocarpa]|nr:hypothetical protein [Varicellaria rhodocarpa]
MSRRRYYDEPSNYQNLDEILAPPPVVNPNEQSFYRGDSIEEERDFEEGQRSVPTRFHHKPLEQRQSRQSEALRRGYEGEDADLTEIVGPPPVDRQDDSPTIPTGAGVGSPYSSDLSEDHSKTDTDSPSPEEHHVSRFATELYTISYLIFFSFLGTLARLGLQALTFYPGAPVETGVLWANFSGSFVFGFLSEDRKVFRDEWGSGPPQDSANGEEKNEDPATAKKRHGTVKKTIPLYIGLATGFCGSFTSFSSFMRDAFLALSNNLPTPISHPTPSTLPPPSISSTVHRNGGYSFMALLAVLILTTTLSLSALSFGAHLALALEPITPTLPFRFTRRILDPLTVFLAFGVWTGAIIMSIFPPRDGWRGEALFALVFAPLGCLTRFYISLLLNAKIPAFPLGTFTVNIAGTLLEGMFYDLQHVPLGGKAGCQVLQGLMDGFCGCLTTVSTWVGELNGLRRRHGYVYGALSLGVGVAAMVAVMGGVRWGRGFAATVCET